MKVSKYADMPFKQSTGTLIIEERQMFFFIIQNLKLA